eukprot:GHVP01053871.1.p1 GENE.GHVP01053871.1~~GHVP01053871.1.p1  ORF type:complete len:212 (-),score=30.41 GHVP01053871.1:4-546(-)
MNSGTVTPFRINQEDVYPAKDTDDIEFPGEEKIELNEQKPIWAEENDLAFGRETEKLNELMPLTKWPQIIFEVIYHSMSPSEMLVLGTQIIYFIKSRQDGKRESAERKELSDKVASLTADLSTVIEATRAETIRMNRISQDMDNIRDKTEALRREVSDLGKIMGISRASHSPKLNFLLRQ